MPAERALPSFVWIKNWPWSNTRACVAHLATQGTELRRGAPCAAAAAALGWRMSPARHARTPKACYGPKQRAQRIEEWLLVLTGVQGCRGSRAEGATARTDGEGGGVLADGSRQGVSGPAEQSRKSGRGLWRCTRVRAACGSSAARNRAGGRLTGDGFGPKFRPWHGRIRGKRARGKLRRSRRSRCASLDGSWCGGAATPRRRRGACAAEQGGGGG